MLAMTTAAIMTTLVLCLAVSSVMVAGLRVSPFRHRTAGIDGSRRVGDTAAPSHKGTSTTIESPLLSSSSSSIENSLSLEDQKNVILLDKLINPVNGNLTQAACEYVNFCDENFDIFLNDRITEISDEKGKQKFGKIRYEINSARQRKLHEADQILKGILSAGDLAAMEAKLSFHLRRAEIDMPFMIILQLNIEDAWLANATQAVQVMKHLERLIAEHQDSLVSPPVRLVRMLVRTDDANVRKQMLRQKLLIGPNLLQNDGTVSAAATGASQQSDGESGPQDTMSPQCEHIVVAAVTQWGGADVKVEELEATISDVVQEMLSASSAGDSGATEDIVARCAVLRTEVQDVLLELETPRVSDRPETCENGPGPSAAAA